MTSHPKISRDIFYLKSGGMDKGEWTEIKRGRKSKYFSIERCTKFKAYLIRIAANLKDIYLINKLT